MWLKAFVAKILSNKFTGNIISSIYNGKIPFHGLRIDISSPFVNKKAASALYFNLYESSEIRFVQKYLNEFQGTIIELGGSVGVVSTFVAKKNPGASVFSFEADERFVPLIQKNYQLNNIENAQASHAVVGDEGYEFNIGDSNVTGSISRSNNSDSRSSDFFHLQEFVTQNNIADYLLISDIEGAEYFLLKQNNFEGCGMMIIELHDIEIDGSMVKISDHLEKIKEKGFEILDIHGGNVVAKRVV